VDGIVNVGYVEPTVRVFGGWRLPERAFREVESGREEFWFARGQDAVELVG
jgi:hypothetical protein